MGVGGTAGFWGPWGLKVLIGLKGEPHLRMEKAAAHGEAYLWLVGNGRMAVMVLLIVPIPPFLILTKGKEALPPNLNLLNPEGGRRSCKLSQPWEDS